MVGSQEDYEAVKQYLKENKNFVDTKGNSFVMFTPSGVQVDILPFGEIEIDDGVSIAGGGLTNIKQMGSWKFTNREPKRLKWKQDIISR